ncbi:MAG: hypothetical protein ABR587_13880, partial [Candidatus Binatia bacterium]
GLYIWLFAWTIRRIHGIKWEYEARYGPMRLGWLVAAMRTTLLGFLFFSFFADMWYHDFFYIIMGMAFALIRLHDHYAETGQVPRRFLIGGWRCTPRDPRRSGQARRRRRPAKLHPPLNRPQKMGSDPFFVEVRHERKPVPEKRGPTPFFFRRRRCLRRRRRR